MTLHCHRIHIESIIDFLKKAVGSGATYGNYGELSAWRCRSCAQIL